MKSLRHVKVEKCVLQFSDVHEHEAYSKLDKVVCFSNPILYGKDVLRLLQRLPAVRKLSCYLKESHDYDEESLEILDFHGELESLKLSVLYGKGTYSIQFPPTLKKLTLELFELPWMALSDIGELNCLVVLKLKSISFPEPRPEMEDLAFPNLKYIQLHGMHFEEWNASAESMPVLEQLVMFYCLGLGDLPSCFEELPSLKKIVIENSTKTLAISALKIRQEQMDHGNLVEVSIINCGEY